MLTALKISWASTPCFMGIFKGAMLLFFWVFRSIQKGKDEKKDILR